MELVLNKARRPSKLCSSSFDILSYLIHTLSQVKLLLKVFLISGVRQLVTKYLLTCPSYLARWKNPCRFSDKHRPVQTEPGSKDLQAFSSLVKEMS